MKRKMYTMTALILLICMILGMASACSTGGGGASTPQTPAPEATPPQTGNTGTDDDTVYTITVNSTFPDLSADGSLAGYYSNVWFFEEVEKRTEGKVVFDKHWSGALYKSSEILDAMQGGALDMAFCTPHAYGEIVPEGFLTTMPLWADSPEDAHNAYRETELWNLLTDAFLDVNMRPLYMLFVNNYGFMAKEPIESTADLKGKLIRSSGTLYKIWFDALGLVSVDINSAEAYDALQKGTLDMDCQGWSTLNSIKLGEVINYCVYPQYQNAVGMCMFINEDLWQRLPQKYRDIIAQVALEAEELTNCDDTVASGQKTLEGYYEEYDIKFSTIEDPETMIEAAYPMFDYWAGMSDGAAKMKEIIYQWAEWS